MVSAGVLVHPRRPAELAHRHHERRVEQATVDQILDQGRDRAVERRDQLPGPLLGLELRGRAVVVPGNAVDRHERRARLHQAAGQQGTLAEGVAAVAVSQGLGLTRNVEGIGHVPAGQHVEGALLVGVHVHQMRARRFAAGRRAVRASGDGRPGGRRRGSGQRQVLDPVRLLVRVRLDDERVRPAAEIGGVMEEVIGAASQVGHGHVRGQAGPVGPAEHGRPPSPSTAVADGYCPAR